MTILVTILIAFAILFHVFAFFMESVFWRTPYAMRAFNMSPENSAITRTFAFNQGVYNLFLAAGLAWSLLAPDPVGFQAKVFFLSCIAIAGIIGGLSVSKRIFVLQALPALMALVLLLVP